MPLPQKIHSGLTGYEKRKNRTAARKSPSFPLASPSLTRNALVISVIALAVGFILWWNGFRIGKDRYMSSSVDWVNRREKVKKAFISSWDAYSKYAWDQLSILFPS
jgi:hypothetical protein